MALFWEVWGELERKYVDEAAMDDAIVINELFEATVEDNLVDPIFVIDYPAALCPLAKRKKGNPDIAERFELYIAKMELANAYTELNDPAEQYENFLIQLRGQEESITKMDIDYITAPKYGMPPAGGLGIGIDRLIMVLSGSEHSTVYKFLEAKRREMRRLRWEL